MGYYFRVKAIDKGELGVGKDEFWIKIWEGDVSIAETTDPIYFSHDTLDGGNIMVRTKQMIFRNFPFFSPIF